MQPRKIPMRQCVGCREMKPKKELVRIVHSPEGEISVDFTGRKAGRGAYICRDASCLAKAEKSRALGRAFSAEIPAEVYDTLKKQLEAEDA
jgi:predicted RNA-binding protein YlxR (DUF448 family)